MKGVTGLSVAGVRRLRNSASRMTKHDRDGAERTFQNVHRGFTAVWLPSLASSMKSSMKSSMNRRSGAGHSSEEARSAVAAAS
jgi:hypothetical protein